MIRLAAQGLTDRQICERLELSMGTVSTYWLRTRQKLGAPSRAACVAALVASEGGAPSRHQVRWSTLFESVVHPVLVIGRDLQVLAANPAAAALAGVPVEQMIGTDLRDGTVTLRHPGGSVVGSDTCPVQRCFRDPHASMSGHFEAHTPCGRTHEVRITVRQMASDSGGPPQEVLMLCEPA